MSEAAPSATPAPTPTNGAAGPQKAVTPVVPIKTDAATGPQTPVRGPDGKFASPAPQKVEDDDPEIDLGKQGKKKRSQVLAELGRAREAAKFATEWQKTKAEKDRLEQREKERIEALKANPRALAKYLREEVGLDDKAFRTALTEVYHGEIIEPEQMTEDQKRAAAAEAQLEKYRKAEAEAKAKAEKDAHEKEAQEAEAALESEIQQAIEKGSIPATKAAVRRIAAVMARYEAKGAKVTVEQAAQLAKREIGSETGEFAAAGSVDQLIELWGKPAVLALAKKMSAWATSERAKLLKAPENKPAPRSEPVKKMTPQQFAEWERKQIKGGS